MNPSDPIHTIEAAPREALDVRAFCVLLDLRESTVCEWVAEGVLRPEGADRDDWTFAPREQDRARRALRLQQDLELNTAALPLVLDLVGEVHRLRRRLRRLEDRFLE